MHLYANTMHYRFILSLLLYKTKKKYLMLLIKHKIFSEKLSKLLLKTLCIL